MKQNKMYYLLTTETLHRSRVNSKKTITTIFRRWKMNWTIFLLELATTIFKYPLSKRQLLNQLTFAYLLYDWHSNCKLNVIMCNWHLVIVYTYLYHGQINLVKIHDFVSIAILKFILFVIKIISFALFLIIIISKRSICVSLVSFHKPIL